MARRKCLRALEGMVHPALGIVQATGRQRDEAVPRESAQLVMGVAQRRHLLRRAPRNGRCAGQVTDRLCCGADMPHAGGRRD